MAFVNTEGGHGAVLRCLLKGPALRSVRDGTGFAQVSDFCGDGGAWQCVSIRVGTPSLAHSAQSAPAGAGMFAAGELCRGPAGRVACLCLARFEPKLKLL